MRLRWTLTQELLEEIEQVSATIDHLRTQFELRVLEFNEFGSAFIQQHGLIADAIVQFSIQLAYVRLHGKIGCIWETAHTRNFRYGRFDHTRPVTLESIELIRAFSEVTSDQVRYSALKRAVFAHLRLLYDCKKGNYVHRHLFALQTLARYQGVEPDIFQDKA